MLGLCSKDLVSPKVAVVVSFTRISLLQVLLAMLSYLAYRRSLVAFFGGFSIALTILMYYTFKDSSETHVSFSSWIPPTLSAKTLGHNGTEPCQHHLGWPSSGETASTFAYVQYATSVEYLCNALINADRLSRFKAAANIAIMYAARWDSSPADSLEARALRLIRKNHPSLKLYPVQILQTSQGDPTWQDSLTKLQVFNMTDYSRVVYLDSDSLVMKNMDHLFMSPAAKVALPRAYWLAPESNSLAQQVLASTLMVIEPEEKLYTRVREEASRTGAFDMEVVNALFNNSAMILPHRGLALLSGEFRGQEHSRYLSEDIDAKWDAAAELAKAYLVHFSDWPLPKPWMPRSKAQWENALPKCPGTDDAKDDESKCANRVAWSGLYEDYDAEKKRICIWN